MDEVFAELQRAATLSERQEVISRALQAGVDQEVLREMLDYLQSFGAREIPAPKGARVAARHKGSWATFFSGLIYRYR